MGPDPIVGEFIYPLVHLPPVHLPYQLIQGRWTGNLMYWVGRVGELGLGELGVGELVGRWTLLVPPDPTRAYYTFDPQ